MKNVFTFVYSLVLSFSYLFASGNDFLDRLDVNEDLRPFYHGVASGDPTQTNVILWTRVTTEETSVEVKWRIALDTAFTQMVDSGVVTTNSDSDYSVKVDVTGLTSNTFYFYEFETGDRKSLIGRTKTAPSAGEVDQLRFVTVSCASYQHGYFNVYGRVADRNDIDAVLHLGDYIYEYAPREYGDFRDHYPTKEIVDLTDYRDRHSQYKLDPNLRKLHQMHPIITTWDDHESADNSYRDGAGNHNDIPNQPEGDWQTRKSSSIKAYFEWMPLRKPDPNDSVRIFRKINYGDIADLFVLDTRLYDRDEEGSNLVDTISRKLLGPVQMAWLKNGLDNSTAKWKVLVQQVMVAPLRLNSDIHEFLILNPDQWDGYPDAREELFGHIRDNNIDNVVVLTGDIHTSWAMDLPFGNVPYVGATGEGSIGVEFVTTSVTSPAAPQILAGFNGILQPTNKHIKFTDLTRKGFGLLDLTNSKTQNDYYYVPTIEAPNNTFVNYRKSYFTNDGDNHLQLSREATVSIYPEPILPPANPRNVEDVVNPISLEEVTLLRFSPNPVIDILSLQFFMQESSELTVQVYAIDGKLVFSKYLGERQKGSLYNEHLDFRALDNGNYILNLTDGIKSKSWKVNKTN